MLASAMGSLTNPSRLQNTFRSVKGKSLDDKAISSYIGHLDGACLVAEAQRYDIKGHAYIDSPKKYYFEDVGLRNARVGFRQVKESLAFTTWMLSSQVGQPEQPGRGAQAQVVRAPTSV